MKQYPKNNLYLFLITLFGEEKALQLLKTYLVGTSKHWNGATIYWQVDSFNKVRSGKIMLYNPETGRRVHKKQNWVHSILKLTDFNLSQCLFGEHLLALPENCNKTIAIVESEKTAIITSYFLNDLIWLASGGIEMFNPVKQPDKFKILIGRKVILYPDSSMPNSYNGDTAFENWSRKASHLKKMGVDVKVSELLEKESTEKERMEGFDIADYFIKETLGLS